MPKRGFTLGEVVIGLILIGVACVIAVTIAIILSFWLVLWL